MHGSFRDIFSATGHLGIFSWNTFRNIFRLNANMGYKVYEEYEKKAIFIIQLNFFNKKTMGASRMKE